MKRITLFFAMLLGLSVFQTASAVDSETARAAKRTSATTISTNSGSTRSVSSAKTSEQNHTANARSTLKNNRATQSVQPRTTTTIQPAIRQRSATTAPTVNERPKTVTARTASTNTRGTIINRSATPRNTNTKTTLTRSAINQKSNRIVRAATLNDDKINEIKSKNYSKCKTVYWECMDEFCANKDTTLRRCACSNRIHEFDDIKQQLTDAEDKMFGFNQRLLTVGLDKDDALAINTATDGEIAFGVTDTSESEKLLKKITQTLNSSNDSKLNNNLSSISLDLDIESAWDSVDSMSGIATTAKSGVELYDAAQPICLEMAREVCSDDEFNITENSYKLAIQQDCNTVAKAYSSKYNTAMEKIHESSALLDMARLNVHQQRNSDDILTCKRKILDKLSEPAVCDTNLYRCLDITGQYIDQSNGSAFLSADLFNLTTLLTAPASTDIKWSRVPGNEQFVTFLNSKKNVLESATEQCRDIADNVWKDFLEDALAQIKLAQNAKLEEIRRSCTKLIAECKTSARKSLEDFDSNALSTFSIMADATVNTMCADVQNACITLIDSSVGNNDWSTGIAGLESDISYEAIIQNCTAIGKTCIMQRCNGTAGNFALCESNNSSIRQSILTTQSCWNEVENCVGQSQNLETMNINVPDGGFTNYKDCDADDIKCLITHTIWGDCTGKVTSDNAIIKQTDENDTSSLLAWFAYNTGKNNSCHASLCPDGYKQDSSASGYENCPICAQVIKPTDSDTNTNMNHIIQVINNITNTCPGGCAAKDSWGNCCMNTVYTDETNNKRICVPSANYKAIRVQTATCSETDIYYCPDNTNKTITLYCVTDDSANYPKLTNADEFDCGQNGYWVLVDEYGNYFNPGKKINTILTKYEGIYKQTDGRPKYTPLMWFDTTVFVPNTPGNTNTTRCAILHNDPSENQNQPTYWHVDAVYGGTSCRTSGIQIGPSSPSNNSHVKIDYNYTY